MDGGASPGAPSNSPQMGGKLAQLSLAASVSIGAATYTV